MLPRNRIFRLIRPDLQETWSIGRVPVQGSGGSATVSCIIPTQLKGISCPVASKRIVVCPCCTSKFTQACPPSASRALLVSDENLYTRTGATVAQIADFGFIINATSQRTNTMRVAAKIKNSNAGSTGTLRIRIDGGVSDSLALTTTSVTYEIKSGTIDISALALGHHTIEIYMDSGAGDTVSLAEIEFWGNE